MKRPIDYLLAGHITQDLTPDGPKLGGTAAYSARTARAFGLRVGLVTSARAGEPLLQSPELAGIQVINRPAPQTTTFTNLYGPAGRRQILGARAARLTLDDIPAAWRSTSIVHLGPVDAETDPALAGQFPGAFVGLTPQGWLRGWEADGTVYRTAWPEAATTLPLATAVVLSPEDLQKDPRQIAEYIRITPLLVITHERYGADVYVQGEPLAHMSTRSVVEVDPTGAGDIFAATFFAWLWRHPGEILDAVRLANYIATTSVTRAGLASAPAPDEIGEALAALDLPALVDSTATPPPPRP
ncbi:MAG: ribokinase [Anaerolineae bacterium]|nr:ribokinase [Anaerolineae bacterium]